jgi:hypothetical protein
MRLGNYPVRWNASSGELDASSAVAGEEEDQRNERQHEDHRMNDHTARDGDDEQNDGESQQHLHPFPFGVDPAKSIYPMRMQPKQLQRDWFTANA